MLSAGSVPQSHLSTKEVVRASGTKRDEGGKHLSAAGWTKANTASQPSLKIYTGQVFIQKKTSFGCPFHVNFHAKKNS